MAPVIPSRQIQSHYEHYKTTPWHQLFWVGRVVTNTIRRLLGTSYRWQWFFVNDRYPFTLWHFTLRCVENAIDADICFGGFEVGLDNFTFFLTFKLLISYSKREGLDERVDSHVALDVHTNFFKSADITKSTTNDAAIRTTLKIIHNLQSIINWW